MSNLRAWLEEKSPEKREHFLREIPRLWLESRQLKKLYNLLSNYDFIEAKINHANFGIQALFEDYNLIEDYKIYNHPEYNAETIESLNLISNALFRATPILSEDKKQLAAQLSGRLLYFKEQDVISKLLQQISQTKTTCLRCLTASLTPPGSPLIRTLNGHSKSVSAVAVTEDGKYAVSGSWDTTLKVWELATGTEVRTLTGHSDSVYAVAVTGDGKYAVSGSWDTTLKVWDLATGKEIHTLTGHSSWVNAVAVTGDSKYAVSSSRDKTLKVWELATGKQIRTLTGHSSWVNAVAVTGDGKYAISGSGDKILKVWELATGKQIRTLTGHSDWVNAVAVTGDDKYAVSGSGDKTLKVWELATGKEIHTLTGHSYTVNAVAVTRDGKYAVSGSTHKTLKVWELATGKKIRTLTGHSNWVNAVAVTGDGKYAVSGSTDKTLKVWDLATGKEIRTLRGYSGLVNAVAVTGDGEYAVSASTHKTLKVWELATGKKIRTLTGHSNSVNAVAVTRDGKYAVSASDDKTLKVWELATGKEICTLTGHSNSVNAVAVTRDGKYAVSASDDKTLKVWDLATGKEIRTLRGYSGLVNAVAVTGDGKYAVSASDDKTLKVWELATGKQIRTFTFRGHSSWVNAVAVTGDGKYAVSVSNNKTLKVWELATGKEICTLTGHSDSVYAVAVTGDGKYAVSASNDKTLKVWDLTTEKEIATFTGEDSILCCAVAQDGVTIVASGESRRLHFLRLQGIEVQSNTSPQSNTQFQRIILEKSQNFTNCEFIFTTINNFLHKYNRGYFTIVGSPGSGKSAILAKYVMDNPDVIYYNAQVEGKNTAEEFLKYICTQLTNRIENGESGVREIPENATEGSWFLSLLLQKISTYITPKQRLIIAIDALDAIKPNSQPPGTNLFYLPRYIPDGVYFILTRRPFKKEQSGLLIEAPSQILDLSEYSLKNWDNEQTFTQHWQKMQGEGLSDVALSVLCVLTSVGKEGVALSEITQKNHADVFDIQEVLDNWFEFLQQQRIGKETRYSLYHPHFRDWLAKQIS